MNNITKAIIALYIVAAIFIGISNYNFIYEIPSIDSQIENKQDAISMVLQNQQNYRDHRHAVDILSNQWNSLKELKPKSTEFEQMNIVLLSNLRTLLVYTPLIFLGEPPSSELKRTWDTYDINQLIEEHDRLDMEGMKKGDGGIYQLPKIQNEVNELSASKKGTRNWSAFFQILGILLTHLAIILGIVYVRH